jgi:hypothetical protein
VDPGTVRLPPHDGRQVVGGRQGLAADRAAARRRLTAGPAVGTAQQVDPVLPAGGSSETVGFHPLAGGQVAAAERAVSCFLTGGATFRLPPPPALNDREKQPQQQGQGEDNQYFDLKTP